jgi:hypothetical protein
MSMTQMCRSLKGKGNTPNGDYASMLPVLRPSKQAQIRCCKELTDRLRFQHDLEQPGEQTRKDHIGVYLVVMWTPHITGIVDGSWAGRRLFGGQQNAHHMFLGWQEIIGGR